MGVSTKTLLAGLQLERFIEAAAAAVLIPFLFIGYAQRIFNPEKKKSMEGDRRLI